MKNHNQQHNQGNQTQHWQMFGGVVNFVGMGNKGGNKQKKNIGPFGDFNH